MIARAAARSARQGEMNAAITINPASFIKRATSAIRRIFSARSAAENPRFSVQPVPHVIAIQHITGAALVDQRALHGKRQRGFAGRREAGEPQRYRLLAEQLLPRRRRQPGRRAKPPAGEFFRSFSPITHHADKPISQLAASVIPIYFLDFTLTSPLYVIA
jgi:hypothetical protein